MGSETRNVIFVIHFRLKAYSVVEALKELIQFVFCFYTTVFIRIVCFVFCKKRTFGKF
jgi:hypothetical protein